MRSTSPWLTRALFSVLLALLIACEDGKPVADAGTGRLTDAGKRDGGAEPDGGHERDAGRDRDAGHERDAGRERDAGAEPRDSGVDASPPREDAGFDAAVPLAADGDACASAAECGSGSCVDGVCCESSCDGTCEACSNAKTGQLDGRCQPVLLGTDPEGECTGLTCRTGVCDGARACEVSPDGTLCRVALGVCDVQESCVEGVCPPDALVASGELCRATDGACDVAETCDGVSGTCPDDAFLASTEVCRSAADLCDAPELCPGDSAACPGDQLMPQGFECRAQAGVCDTPESCNGSSPSCPTDTVRPEGTVCRASQGACDQAEYCGGGTIKTCGADAKSTATCRPAAGTCDVAEQCNGIENACPTDVFRSSIAEVCAGGLFCSGVMAACVECRSHSDCVGGEVCSSARECITVKRVFATSSTHNGNLGGLAGADGICQSRADAASLSGTYKAWLSSSSVTASSRLSHATIPYYLPNNVRIADDWADLVDGSLDNPFNADESGVALTGFLPWTGATQTGGIASYQCGDWTSDANAAFGSNGSSTRTDTAWSLNNIRRCDTVTRIYCLQQ